MAETHARLRPSSKGSSCSPCSNHSFARVHSKATRLATLRAGPTRSGGQPTDVGVEARQVHPSELPILHDVAEDVRQLEGDTESVRQGHGPLRILRPEDGEGEPTDRAGDAAAITDEVVDCLVGRPEDIHLAPVDDLAEGRHRQLIATSGIGDGDEHGVDGAVIDRVDLLADTLQASELLLRLEPTVPDVVDTPREGVDS